MKESASTNLLGVRTALITRGALARVAAAVIALGLMTQIAPRVSAEPYRSDKGYEITPISGWVADGRGVKATDVLIYGRPINGFMPNIGAMVRDAKPAEDLPSLAVRVRAEYTRIFTRFHLTGERYSTLAGDPSYEITGTYTQGSPARRLRMHQVFVLHGGSSYIFTCTDTDGHYAKSLTPFDAMLRSIRWTA